MNDGITSKNEVHVSRILVLLQFLTSASLVLSARLESEHVVGFTMATVGLCLGLWAIAAVGPTQVSIMPEVKAKTQLVTAGPYRFVRHPMYTSLMLFCGGFVVTPFHWWKIAAWLVLLFVLVAKSRIEERRLMARFADYDNYRKRTHRFVPFVW
jgi:protein-S-isoprenylcysteine O-methyltransferase Ste14